MAIHELPLRPLIGRRDFSGWRSFPNVWFRVNSLDWEAQGGCQAASITAFGEELALWELIETLRGPVRIQDENAEAVWWGFVGEVQVRVDAIEVGATIDSMVNKIAVAYSYVAAGSQEVGERKTTSWASDTESIAEYGTKEFLSSMDGLSDAAAVARRDAILGARRWPVGTGAPFGQPRGRVRRSGAKKSLSATLFCRGWSDTLRWRYAAVSGTSSVATTTQITNLESTYGEFITGVDIEAASGISSSEYRDGDTTVWEEILALLDSGGANSRRLLCAVDVDRRLKVWEEPASSEVKYFMDSHGDLYGVGNVLVDEFRPPVGKWLRLRDVVPGSADVTKLATPELQFIEGARWDSENGLQLQFRGQPSIEDMFKVGN